MQTRDDGTLVLPSTLLGIKELVDNNNLQEGSKVRILAAREDQDKIAVAGDSSGLKKESNVCYIQLQMKSKIANGDSSHDEELTSLSWLQNNDLLQSMNLASSSAETNKAKTTEGEEKNPPKTDTQLGQVEKEESENESCGQDGSDPSNDLETSPSSMKLVASGGAENSKRALAKPPHSFSMLIFLAIESSSAKALPVRDIYSWITQHFPYYRLAGNSGWKNSVRHNLSLNRCFCKFERGLNVGKGSLWMVDPVHRPQLMQSLCKVRNLKSEILQQLLDDTSKDSKASATVQVASPKRLRPLAMAPAPTPTPIRSSNVPDPKLFPYLSRRLAINSSACSDVDAATAMLALGDTRIQPTRPDSNFSRPTLILPPKKDYSMRKHQYHAGSMDHIVAELKREPQIEGVDEVAKPNAPSSVDDHTYSFNPRPSRCWSQPSPAAETTTGRKVALQVMSQPVSRPVSKPTSQSASKPTSQLSEAANDLQIDSDDEVESKRSRPTVPRAKCKTKCRGRGRGRGKGRWR